MTWCTFRINKKKAMEKQSNYRKKPSRWRYIIPAVVILFLITAALVYIYVTQEEPKPDRDSEIVIRNAAAETLYGETRIKKEPNDLTDEDFSKITAMTIIPSMGSGGNYYWINHATGRNFTALEMGELSDIQLLKKFTNLKRLHLENIRFPQKDIPQWMKILAKLGIYDLNERFSIDLTPIKNLTNIESLILIQTRIENLEPLSGLINLKRLYIPEIGLSSIEPLRGLINLQDLTLSEAQISSLEPLKDLKNLKILNVNDTKITDLEPIKGLTQLQTLELCSTQVSDIEPIRNFTNMYNLDISGTKVTNIEPIKDLKNLHYLSLVSTNVSDLEPLRGLTNLIILQIGYTPVSDLKPIKELKNLEYIYIENCINVTLEQINDLKKALPGLKFSEDAID
jgi:Leucine-rich repeat (LRR) protein